LEAEELRDLAKDDVKGIDAWSDGEIKRVKLERERRIAARREQLQIRLEELRTVVSREVDAVELAIATYRAEIDEYFRRLEHVEAVAETSAQPEPEAQPVAQAVGTTASEAATATDDVTSAVSSESSGSTEDSDGSQETVGALAEARVVMPRASGAGSWLRWPNSSSDHTDSN